ncbi:MFS general substrate transporter [Phlegmacium glaucopus]|nr:MFS general substrate transporter [Phlegmacium glaucopus]
MSSEETPLLATEDVAAVRDAVYQRFAPRTKHAIVAMVSGYGVMPFFVIGTFIPCIPQIARDLNSTGAIVNLTVSLSAFASSIGCLISASYSTHYGRRPVYLYSLPALVVGSIGVSLATNIPNLLFWRFLQALGAASGLVLGAGVIGDIYKLEERGRAMSVFFAVSGSAAFYYSWRAMQAFLGVIGLVEFGCMYFLFPETSQPGARGIDKLASEDGLRHPAKFIFINPLRPLALLRSPNLFLISIILSISLVSRSLLVVPLAYTLGLRYNIPNEALVGACFIPSGIGLMLGAPIIGRISDRTVIKWRQRRGGAWYPEDRLRASLVPFAVLIPLPVLVFGLVNKFMDGPLGLIIGLICHFVNGLGVEMGFGPCTAYLIDKSQFNSPIRSFIIRGLRSTLMALAIASFLPMINTFGIVATHALSALLVWLSFGILCCIIRYGDQMRALVDVGFSTMENN